MANRTDISNAYRYPRLDASLRTIRLIRLLACSTTDDIRCELTHSYLDSPKPYDAVSYCWGISTTERQRSRPITLDGMKFMVSSVVEDIFLRLHNPERDQLFWIDLICIDQDDVNDRELQVSRMADIFRQAQQVVISLGPHYSCRQSTPVKTLEGALRRVMSHPSHTDKSLRASVATAALLVALPSPLAHSSLDSAVSSAAALASFVELQASVRELLTHPWFSRVWVVQETALARSIIIIAGGAVIGGQRLAHKLQLFSQALNKSYSSFGRQRHQELGTLAYTLQRCQPLLCLMGGEASLKQENDLLSLLRDFRSWKATLPSDKVFGLLEMCGNAWKLEVNYKITHREVFMDVVCLMMQRTLCLDALSFREPRRELRNGMPSWVPDWTVDYRPSVHVAPPRVETDLPPQIVTPKFWQRTSKQDAELRAIQRFETARYGYMNTIKRTGILPVRGCTIAEITSVFNDGSIEVKSSTTCLAHLTGAELGKALSTFSEHLTRLHISHTRLCGAGLSVGDQVCVLRGSTGIAILRPIASDRQHFELVALEHSQYKRFGTIWDGVKDSVRNDIPWKDYDKMSWEVTSYACFTPTTNSLDLGFTEFGSALPPQHAWLSKLEVKLSLQQYDLY